MSHTSSSLDQSAQQIALAPRDQRRALSLALRKMAQEHGVYPASIGRLYRAIAAKQVRPLTVPALNVRGLTYDVARAVWQACQHLDARSIIFELAPIESEVTDQTFHEYVALILAAAVREGYQGPVYVQGDHFKLTSAIEAEQEALRSTCLEALDAGIFQIDLDASSLAQATASTAEEQQHHNAAATAQMISYLRRHQPAEIELVLGGEVGEIGSQNTSPEELHAFMTVLRRNLPEGCRGIDKLSVQTGTRHGGVVNTDGTPGVMLLDLALTKTLSTIAQREYSLPGVVQHGASTLSWQQLRSLPEAGAIEVHLATGLQNVIFDHPALSPLMDHIRAKLVSKDTSRNTEGDTPKDTKPLTGEQHFYMNRWRAWGMLKRDLWTIPESDKRALREAILAWCTNLFTALAVHNRGTELEPFTIDKTS